jgi:hypothetical protein
VTCGMIFSVTIVYIVNMMIAYDGKCGGFFPGMSARRSCSLWQYATGDMLAIGIILAITYWPVVLTLLTLPPFVGHLFDRRELHRDD